MLRRVEAQITEVERAVRHQAGQRPGFTLLQTVLGIRPTLASTILRETGDIRRFTPWASSPRIVGVSAVSISAMANARGPATRRTAINI